MPKRISKEEFDQRITALRAAYVRDIEAAGGDSGKADLAAKKYEWGEEAARDDFNQRSGLYKFFDSIPLIGRPVTFILDNVDKGTEQHGRFWGVTRGLFVGLIIAVMLVALSEGANFVFEIGRSWININKTQPILVRQRQAAEDRSIQDREEHVMQLGRVLEVTTPINYYLVDRLGRAQRINGRLASFEVVDTLNEFEENPVASASSRSLPSGEQITPFFFQNEHRDVATIEVTGKGTCVFASLDGKIILVPLSSYKAASLPMHAPAATAPESQSTDSSHSRSPATISPHVPFFSLTPSEFQNPRDLNNQSAVRLKIEHPSDAETLPQGTSYSPAPKVDDPNGVETIEAVDGNLYILVILKNPIYGSNDQVGVIPKSEYDAYLRSRPQ